MSLIYSRPRIKFPKFLMFNYKRKDNNVNIKKKRFIFCLLIIFIIFYIVLRAVTPIFNELCVDKAISIATLITNNETTKAVEGYEYSDFIKIHKDDNNNIIMLESNMININNVMSDVASRIQVSIDNIKDEDITISLGSFTGISILAGRGYPVPIRISTIGNVKTDVKSEFIEKGINQTLHRLYLEIECETSILTPFNTIKEKINNQFIIAENVIIGNIPNSYYNLNGIKQSDALEVIE